MTNEDIRAKYAKLCQMMIVQLSIIIVLIRSLKNKSRRAQIHSRITEHRERVRNELMKHIIGSDRCYDIIRMSPKTFLNLCTLLRDRGGLTHTRRASIEEQVAKFLHMVGHNVRNRVMSFFFRRSGETVSRHFHRVLDALIEVEGIFLKQPDGTQIPPEILNNNRFYPYFKDCIGAIDCTHVRVKVPADLAPRYRGRKDYPTQNVLVECTFDLKFTYVLVGWEGTASDSRIVKSALTRAYPLKVPRGKYYLGDAGFPLKACLITPYRGERYHLQEYSRNPPRNPRELFNHRHSSLRMSIECAFGVLKQRFPILQTSTEPIFGIKTQYKIITACCILHNYLMSEDPNQTLIDEVQHDLANKIDSQEGRQDQRENTGSDSDCDWEEGPVQDKNTIFPGYNEVGLKSSGEYDDNNNDNNDSEVEWEEGDCNGTTSTLCPAESGKVASKGHLEEESDLQEAIRRSIESTQDGKLKYVSSSDEHSSACENKLDPNLEHGDNGGFGSNPMDLNDNMVDSNLPREGHNEQSELHETVGDKRENHVTRNNPETSHFNGSQSKSFVAINSNNTDTLINEPSKLDGHDISENSISDTTAMMMDEVPNPIVAEESLDNHNDGKTSFCCNSLSNVGVTEEDKNKLINESEPMSNSTDNTNTAILSMDSSLKGAKKDIDMELKLPSVNNDGNFSMERTSNLSQGSMNIPGDFPVQLDELQLNEEMQILDREYRNLENEQRKLECNAESVDSELFTECQELLQMFGLPYIIAPMEAEAQCAYLELSKLVDGVVTDDSDVFLFGARSVYKNIFDDRKYVETYFMEDVEKELGLNREKLIRMALLLGSDYTEGVSGIGIVNAIEVLNAFPEEDGFLKFRQWVESPDPTILGRLDAKSVSKKGSKLEEKESPDYIQETKQTFMDKHRNVSKNWHIPSSFPSETVISAYISPQVDKSTEPFAWGKPDQLVLRKMCWEKFGWSSQKADELLLPVLKQYNKHETQLRLEAFYSFNERFAKIRSKRIKKAVKGITGKPPSDLIADSSENMSNGTKNGIGSSVDPEDDKLETSKGTEKSLAARKKSKAKESTKRKNDGNTVAKQHTKKKKINDVSSAPAASEIENLQPCMQTEGQYDGEDLVQIKSSRGRGRGKGVGVKRGREKKSRHFQPSETETSSTSLDIDNHEPRAQVDLSTVPEVKRRSMRSRKPVNYSFEDLEVEDAVDSFDQSNQKCLHRELVEEKSTCIDGSSIEKESGMLEIPPKDNLPADYLEPETDAGAATPRTHPSDDYLEMGGGFCVDDSEMDNHDATDDTKTSTVNSPPFSELLGETDRDKSSSDILFFGAEKATSEIQDGGACKNSNKLPNDQLLNAADIGVLIPENAHHNSESSNVAFSAMPFLRKKRKK